MAEDLEGFNELFTLLTVALEVEAEHRACAFGQQLLRQLVAGVALQQRVAHAAHKGLAGQELHHFLGVADVAGHAQAQGLYALQDQPGAVRAHASAEVAQAFAPGPQQKGAHGTFLAEIHVVKALVGRG